MWLPALISEVSLLSTVAVISTPTDCSLDNLTVFGCSSSLSSCISTPLLSYTQTYLSGLSPCTLYTIFIKPDHHPDILWTVQRQTKVSLGLNITLGYTSGTISTFYKRSCKISSGLWSVSICPMMESMQQLCRHFLVHPDRLETTARLDNLLPCTQYVVRWVAPYARGLSTLSVGHIFCLGVTFTLYRNESFVSQDVSLPLTFSYQDVSLSRQFTVKTFPCLTSCFHPPINLIGRKFSLYDSVRHF